MNAVLLSEILTGIQHAPGFDSILLDREADTFTERCFDSLRQCLCSSINRKTDLVAILPATRSIVKGDGEYQVYARLMPVGAEDTFEIYTKTERYMRDALTSGLIAGYSATTLELGSGHCWVFRVTQVRDVFLCSYGGEFFGLETIQQSYALGRSHGDQAPSEVIQMAQLDMQSDRAGQVLDGMIPTRPLIRDLMAVPLADWSDIALEMSKCLCATTNSRVSQTFSVGVCGQTTYAIHGLVPDLREMQSLLYRLISEVGSPCQFRIGRVPGHLHPGYLVEIAPRDVIGLCTVYEEAYVIENQVLLPVGCAKAFELGYKHRVPQSGKLALVELVNTPQVDWTCV